MSEIDSHVSGIWVQAVNDCVREISLRRNLKELQWLSKRQTRFYELHIRSHDPTTNKRVLLTFRRWRWQFSKWGGISNRIITSDAISITKKKLKFVKFISCRKFDHHP